MFELRCVAAFNIAQRWVVLTVTMTLSIYLDDLLLDQLL